MNKLLFILLLINIPLKANRSIDSLINLFDNRVEQKIFNEVTYDLAFNIGQQIVKQDINQAYEFNFKLQKIAAEHSNSNLKNITFINQGRVYASKGIHLKAIEQYFKASESIKYSDSGSYAWNQIMIGNVLYEMEFYDDASAFYKEANDIFDKHYLDKLSDSMTENHYNNAKAVCYNNIALCELKFNNPDKAFDYFQKAYNYRLLTDRQLGIAYQYYYFARVHTHRNNLDSAVKYLDIAMEVISSSLNEFTYDYYNQMRALGTFYSFYAEISFLKDNYEEMYYYADKAIDIYDSTSNNIDKFEFCFDLIDYEIKLGNIDIAIEKSVNILNATDKSDFLNYNIKALEYLSELHHKKANFTQSAFYYTQANNLSDSLDNANQHSLFLRIRQDVLNEQKANEIEGLKNAELLNQTIIKNQNNFIIILVICILLVIGLLIFIFINYKSKIKLNEQLNQKNNELSDINNALNESKEELSQNNLKLLESEKRLQEAVKTKDSFFSIIAHDLKSPISSYKNSLEFLTENYNKLHKDDLQEMIELQFASAKHLLLLLDNLLTWSRSQSGSINFSPDYFLIHKLVENVIDILRNNIKEKNLNVINNIPKDMEIYADLNMLHTVFRNLISNAIKFTDNNGKIVVSSSKVENKIYFSVEDTGVGIHPDNIDNIFRVDTGKSTLGTNKEKGTGLGLVLSKEFIEYHNGEISVSSKINEGSEFKFYISEK